MLLLVSFGLHAQDAKRLSKAVEDFDKALINKDSVVLKQLLNEHISYGHSNGWMQSKNDVINDLFNGKLTYKQISHKDDQVNIEGNTASVRMVANLDVIMDNKPMQFKLSVLQAWIWKNKEWQLFARQSVKLN